MKYHQIHANYDKSLMINTRCNVSCLMILRCVHNTALKYYKVKSRGSNIDKVTKMRSYINRYKENDKYNK